MLENDGSPALSEASSPAPAMDWYIVHTYSGFEDRVVQECGDPAEADARLRGGHHVEELLRVGHQSFPLFAPGRTTPSAGSSTEIVPETAFSSASGGASTSTRAEAR